MPVKKSVDIWLQPTTTASFSSDNSIITLDTNQAILVYSGNLNCHQGWNFFDFTSPYVWDGVNNLVVIVDDNSGVDESVPLTFGVAQCSGQKTISYYGMLNNIDPTSPNIGYVMKSRFNARPLLQLISCGGASCHEPINLVASAISFDSANVSWQGVSHSYEVSFKKTDDSEWSQPVTVTTSSTAGSYTFNDLNEMTQYDFRVRQFCISGVFSEWAESSFTTATRPCLPPTTPYVTNVGYDRATIGWTSHNDQSIAYILLSHNAYDSVIVADHNPFTLTSLAQDITYSVAVADSCTNNGTTSDYSNTVSFTTASCLPPYNVSVSSISATSALVSWSGDSQYYTIEYGIGNFTPGNGTTVDNINGNSITLNGLTPDVDYTLYIRAKCSETAYSVWSERTTFHTATSGIGLQSESPNPALDISPNPAKDKTTINIVGINGEVALTLVDMSGRIIKETTAFCGGDSCTATVELRHLAAGTYFVRASAQGINIVHKLVVK